MLSNPHSHEQAPSSVRRIVKITSSIPMLKEALEAEDFEYPLDDDILYDLKVVKQVAEAALLSPESKRSVHKWVQRVKRRDRAERMREHCGCACDEPRTVEIEEGALRSSAVSALASSEGRNALLGTPLSPTGGDLLTVVLQTPAGLRAIQRALGSTAGRAVLDHAVGRSLDSDAGQDAMERAFVTALQRDEVLDTFTQAVCAAATRESQEGHEGHDLSSPEPSSSEPTTPRRPFSTYALDRECGPSPSPNCPLRSPVQLGSPYKPQPWPFGSP